MEIHYEFSVFPLLLEVDRARLRVLNPWKSRSSQSTFKASPELQGEKVSFEAKGVQPRVLVLSRPGIPDPAEVSHRKRLAGVLWYKMVALVSCLWLKIWQFYLKLALKDLALNSASIFYFLDISSHVMELLGSTPVLMCIDSCALTRVCPVTVVLL